MVEYTLRFVIMVASFFFKTQWHGQTGQQCSVVVVFCAQLLIVHLPKLKATHHLCVKYSGKYEWGKLRQLLDDEE